MKVVQLFVAELKTRLFRTPLSSVSNNFDGCRGTAKHWKIRVRRTNRGWLPWVIRQFAWNVSPPLAAGERRNCVTYESNDAPLTHKLSQMYQVSRCLAIACGSIFMLTGRRKWDSEVAMESCTAPH